MMLPQLLLVCIRFIDYGQANKYHDIRIQKELDTRLTSHDRSNLKFNAELDMKHVFLTETLAAQKYMTVCLNNLTSSNQIYENFNFLSSYNSIIDLYDVLKKYRYRFKVTCWMTCEDFESSHKNLERLEQLLLEVKQELENYESEVKNKVAAQITGKPAKISGISNFRPATQKYELEHRFHGKNSFNLKTDLHGLTSADGFLPTTNADVDEIDFDLEREFFMIQTLKLNLTYARSNFSTMLNILEPLKTCYQIQRRIGFHDLADKKCTCQLSHQDKRLLYLIVSLALVIFAILLYFYIRIKKQDRLNRQIQEEKERNQMTEKSTLETINTSSKRNHPEDTDCFCAIPTPEKRVYLNLE